MDSVAVLEAELQRLNINAGRASAKAVARDALFPTICTIQSLNLENRAHIQP
jgi:hypothetical protein